MAFRRRGRRSKFRVRGVRRIGRRTIVYMVKKKRRSRRRKFLGIF